MQLQWFDRSGKAGATLGAAALLMGAALSPDGTRAATARADRSPNRERDLWVYDVARAAGTRFTAERGNDRNAVWSPDGSQIAFTSNRGNTIDLYVKLANGGSGETPLLKNRAGKFAQDWSPDGKFLLYTGTGSSGSPDLFVLPMTGGDREPRVYLESEFVEADARFSPDGHWVAYSSNESGRFDVYVRPFPDARGGKTLVSGGGGSTPRWRRDGLELFYLSADRKMVAVTVSPESGFKVGSAVELFTMPYTTQNDAQVSGYDVTADGKRFLIVTMPGGRDPGVPMMETLTLIQNWTAVSKN